MIRADLVTGLVLAMLGIAVAVESWRMPRFTDVGSDVWTAPGLVPGMLGVALTLMALILVFRSVAVLARAEARPGSDAVEAGGWGRVALAVGLCVGYGAGLVGRVPFWLATFVFAFAFIGIFGLLEPGGRAAWPRRLAVAAAVAAAAAIVVPFVFETLFLVRLP